jgi:hypothetical protein
MEVEVKFRSQNSASHQKTLNSTLSLPRQNPSQFCHMHTLHLFALVRCLCQMLVCVCACYHNIALSPLQTSVFAYHLTLVYLVMSV